MKNAIYTLLLGLFLFSFCKTAAQKIFDTHIHGDKDVKSQIDKLKSAGVYKAAVSTSWQLQQTYESEKNFQMLRGLMLACPEGKVPYSGQYCFTDKKDFPDPIWVENQIKENKIDFIGEVLSQYYGISPSNDELFTYYAIAEKKWISCRNSYRIGRAKSWKSKFQSKFRESNFT